jgi:hypothetical protein
MPSKDKELAAIGSIIALLTPLDDGERGRVIEYVLKRMQLSTLPAVSGIDQEETETSASSTRPVTDIRSLTAEKQPRSATEMVALVAYYLSELAPQGEKADTVNSETIRRYFKMAGFPLPSVLRNVLPNASAAGYLVNVSRGEYRLNPVGYNLVVHGLPRSGSPGPATPGGRVARRSSARKGSKGARRGR